MVYSLTLSSFGIIIIMAKESMFSFLVKNTKQTWDREKTAKRWSEYLNILLTDSFLALFCVAI